MEPPDHLLGDSAVWSFTGISTSLRNRLVKSGEFPTPVKLGRQNRWLQSELTEWFKNLQEHKAPRLTKSQLSAISRAKISVASKAYWVRRREEKLQEQLAKKQEWAEISASIDAEETEARYPISPISPLLRMPRKERNEQPTYKMVAE